MTKTSLQADQQDKARDIRSLRRSAGLSFSELAAKAGVSETDLRKAERGLELSGNGFASSVAAALGVSERSLRQSHRRLAATTVPGEGYRTARPDGGFEVSRSTKLKKGSIPILDLFCGTGGFSHGFEQTGKFQVVRGLDFLPDRIETFAANHREASATCGDIRQITADDLCSDGCRPEVVIGGPPCQGFSSIRPFRMLTEEDPRNNLFEHFGLVVDALRPQWFVMENVVGLLTNQKGQTLNAVLDFFGSIGYTVSWRVLNAAFYGLPQRRERVIIVGSREGKQFNWPEPTHFFNGATSMAGQHGQHHQARSLWKPESLQNAVTVEQAIGDLPELRSGESACEYAGAPSTEYQQEIRGGCSALTLHEATRHSAKMLNIIRHAGYSKAALPDGLVTSGFSTCYSRLEPDRPSVTITVNFVHPSSNKCIHPTQDRALTPREGARLQGFPDSFEFMGTRAQVVKQIGNAVPPLLGRVIAQSLARLVD